MEDVASKKPSGGARRVPIEVQGDHLERLARCSPSSALAELIWNALDADATQVSVQFTRNGLDGIDKIVVIDNGRGIGAEGHDVDATFRRLGGSWKARAQRTSQNRVLHGKAGEGRFKACALGDRVEWATRRLESGKVIAFMTAGIRKVPNFTITDPIETTGEPGTTVSITGLSENLRLVPENLVERLTHEFALYLQQYSHVHLTIDGRRVDPAGVQDRRSELERISVPLGNGKTVEADLTVIEWISPRASRALWLCDEHGFSLHEQAPGIQAPGFAFTAYLKSAYFRELQNDGLVDSELVPARARLLDTAKHRLRDFRERAAEQAKNAVERWREEQIYPYAATAASPVEQVERQVFDICALNLADHLPDFDKSDVKQKKLAFRLLKEAIERNPESLRTILAEVLGLTKEKQDTRGPATQHDAVGHHQRLQGRRRPRAVLGRPWRPAFRL